MMNDAEINALAEELVNEQVALASDAALATRRKYMPRHGFCCPRCKKANVGNTKLEDVSECFECGTLYGEGYQFILPTWARAQNAHFRRFVALSLNIQGE